MHETIENIETVIVGLGKTGLSCARYLKQEGVKFAVVDSRTTPPELDALNKLCPGVPVYLGGFNENILGHAGRLLLSPGVAVNEPEIQKALKNGVLLSSDIEIFCQRATRPIIAVTGSNGKSTVVTLVTEMIKSAGKTVELGGNIGPPALYLFNNPVPEFYVLELSSFQLETVRSLNATAAVILNVSKDHMDRYPDLPAYALAKEKIYSGNGVMVINADDEFVAGMKMSNRRTITYSLSESEQNEYRLKTTNNTSWLMHNEDELMPVTEIPLKGDHNISNILAALALGTAIELPTESMLDAVRNFHGLPHRCQWICRINDVDWINDSKATNVGAACAAIKGMGKANNLVIIAGGEGKGADFAPLVECMINRVKAAILIGRDAKLIAAAMENVIPYYFASTMEDAVAIAAGLAAKNNIVLLSPACASLDMYLDYQARGDAFTAAVKALSQRECD